MYKYVVRYVIYSFCRLFFERYGVKIKKNLSAISFKKQEAKT
jgi:hypothetical protein